MGIAGIFDRQDAVAFLARGAGNVAQRFLALEAHAQDLARLHALELAWCTKVIGQTSAVMSIVWSGWFVITRQLYRDRRAVKLSMHA